MNEINWETSIAIRNRHGEPAWSRVRFFLRYGDSAWSVFFPLTAEFSPVYWEKSWRNMMDECMARDAPVPHQAEIRAAFLAEIHKEINEVAK